MNLPFPEPMRRLLLPTAAALAIAAAFSAGAAENSSAGYVGTTVCVSCHADQAARWKNSDHARSMQPARPDTVLGNFDDARFTQHGVTSRFSRRDNRYFVTTEGPDGKEKEYPVAYTFGHYPLQQYLIEMPGGRLQALGIAWDSRPAETGGQRWFHLYPETKLRAGEAIHWTGRDQNWNFMCAPCHSTDLKKNFDPAKNQFTTTWSELNVACEACHGPGAGHERWAQGKDPANESSKGLLVELQRSRDLAWRFATPEARIASPSGKIEAARGEADVCFPCHARRQELGNSRPGKPFLDNYQPTLLDQNVYHADGQINDEAFEYGSFTQSRMYRAGVSCGNCHEPHSLKLREEGNRLCSQCHQAGAYDTPQHHRHQSGGEGARCVACHMPAKTYMGVDRRRDHGFRVPNPAQADALGTPNPCTQCHADRPKGWAAKALAAWGVKLADEKSRPGAAFSSLWRGSPQAQRALTAIAADPRQSPFHRASALAALPGASEAATRQAISRASSDSDGLVRLGAARSFAAFEYQELLALGAPKMLDDPLRAVRVETARALVGIPEKLLSAAQQRSLKSALAELIGVEQANADRPESHVNLAQIYARQGKPSAAEQALRTALRLDKTFVPAYINLADLYRTLGRENDGESALNQARKLAPKDAAALHSLALLRIRQGRKADALALLRQASALQPANPQYAYLLALALSETGAGDESLAIVEKALRRQPDDAALRQLQIALERRHGRIADATRHAAELQALQAN